MTGIQDLLHVTGLCKRYNTPVLQEFGLSIGRGEVHALVGSNGAGKSTFARILSGLAHPDSGQMMLDGHAYRPASKRDAEGAGVVIVLQELNVLGTLTLAENIFLNRLPRRAGFIRAGTLRSAASEALGRVGLGGIDPDTRADVLGVGQQQLVEIAGALSRNCRLLILDEPTAALTDPEIAQLFQNIRRLKAEGVGILYVSHRMEEIRRIADRVTVMRDGRSVATHEVNDTMSGGIVREMVGHDLPPRRDPGRQGAGDVALSVRHLRAGRAVHDISFDVCRGEIVGLAGLMGAGRTETLRAIFGADAREAGEVTVHGRALSIRAPADAVRAGIALIPEDRKRDGLLMPLATRVNATLSTIGRHVLKVGWLDLDAERRAADASCTALDVRCASIEQPVGELSGGNQQKVMIARWVARNSDILLCDEPTRGIDVAAKDAIYTLLRDLAHQGKAVVVVSSDLVELMALCDRIVVIAHGRTTAEFTPAEWTQEAITRAAFNA